MGTGIGESTYSFIEQGKIEIFLSYKPEDKRLIFDEASGIVKYKESKKEALKKLEETEENLLRLEDIISEVKRQTRYLERQVEKTRKFKEHQEKLIEAEKKIAAFKFSDLEKKINNILEELNAFKEKESAKDNELRENKAKWEELNSSLRDIRKNFQEASSQVFSLNAQIETSVSHTSINQQRIKELETRNETLQNTKATASERLGLQEKRVEEARVGLVDIEKNIFNVDGQIKQLKEERNTLGKEVSAENEKINKEKIRVLEFEGTGVNLRNSLIEIQTNASSLTNRKKRLLLDKAKIEEFLREKKDTLDKTLKEAENLENIINSLKNKKNSLVSKEQELVSLKDNLQNRLIEREKDLVELNSYYEFLKDLRIKYDTFSVKKTITIVFNEEPKNISKLIVSLKGADFNKEGNLYKASVEARVISLEEAQLQEKIDLIHREIGELKARLSDLEQQKLKLTQDILLESNEIEEEDRKLQAMLQEKNNLNRDWTRLKEEFEIIEREITANRQELDSYEKKQSQLQEELASCEENLNISKNNLQKSQEIINRDSERIKDIDIETAKGETQKLSLHRERESLNSRILILTEEKDSILKNLTDMDREKDENLLRIKALSDEIERLDISIRDDGEKIKLYSKKKEELEKEEFSFAAKIEEEKKLLELIEKELGELRASVYNKKLEIQGLDYEKEKIKDYLKQVYHIEFDQKSFSEHMLEETSENMDSLSEQKEELKKKIEALGEVNLVAIEEFEELKKREDFLQKQKEDLITSKENLKKAIQKINRTSKELFLETFAKIEEEFKKNFKFLFGGGRAQLILLDQENVLESGVEIEVQPPGKKLQNVTLLSGGEKALTTTALIFAIFRVRPSPICVLDEIDAPLDEANVDRFNHLLKEFSSFSQFILITHNKKTMSKADILYGVTMQEKGVSKLVSVKFAADEANTTSQEVAPS
jgi:chromosome segregation protein